MAYKEKMLCSSKGCITPGEKEDYYSGLQKDPTETKKEDRVLLTARDISIQPPGKNFEFVAVKEEIVDDYITDDNGIDVEAQDMLDEGGGTNFSPSENQSSWIYATEINDGNGHCSENADSLPVNLTTWKQPEIQSKYTNIQETIIKQEQEDFEKNSSASDPDMGYPTEVEYSLELKNKCTSFGNSLTNDSYVEHVEVNYGKNNALKQMSFLNNSFDHNDDIKSSRSYRCPICYKTFTLQSNMKKHKRLHSGVKPYHCSQCKQCFTRKADLERHSGVHTNDRPYHCSVCRKSFKYKYGLSMHFKLHRGEGHECTTCKKSFSTRHILERHKRTHSDQKIYQCSLCKAVFNERNCLSQHARLHTQERPRPFECPVCEKKFITRHDLERHCRTHTGEKPYQCATCEKAFSDRGDLTRHLVVHSGEKRYICNICNKAFTMQSSLKTHARVHSGDKPYPCIVCKKRFSQKANVVRHMKTHGIDKTKAGNKSQNTKKL